MTKKEITLSEHLTRAGKIKSEAKTSAARENGRKGGRGRKSLARQALERIETYEEIDALKNSAEVDQDWDRGITTYTFRDRSKLRWSSDEIKVGRACKTILK